MLSYYFYVEQFSPENYLPNYRLKRIHFVYKVSLNQKYVENNHTFQLYDVTTFKARSLYLN